MAFQEYLAFFHPLPLTARGLGYLTSISVTPVTDPSSNKIPFGLRDGRMVEVSEVKSGLACRCVCPPAGNLSGTQGADSYPLFRARPVRSPESIEVQQKFSKTNQNGCGEANDASELDVDVCCFNIQILY